jgi:glycerol-3-phosphate dehydrogenase subunit C
MAESRTPIREGNLAAPTRHAIDWQTTEYYDESSTMEVDGVDKADYAKVVDQCDLCYMTKCPYVPPHEWNRTSRT